ncbi:signal peptidase II [Motilibacter sp. E257]|uniref:Lipoprotein signal peptidase n=1 Tax=Motilibacter deserti TaxID=2714956 RepID=A0ABX0GP88_9ACTN|nr:signal peptidase II [Motilibacter deserti]
MSHQSPPSPARGRGRRPAVLALGLVALVVYAVDQVTKVVAKSALEGKEPVEVLDGVLQLRLVLNPGAAFGIAGGATVLFTVVAAVVAVVIIRMARTLHSTAWAVALGLLLGGALGNLTDRVLRAPGLFRGHVVDFLELPNWPVFNVADMAICCAAALLVLLSLRGVQPTGPAHGDDAHGDDAEALADPGREEQQDVSAAELRERRDA